MLTSCTAWEANAPRPSLSWTDCTAEVQCSTLTVPADRQDPGGPATALNLVRLPASGHRLGSVVVGLGSGNGTNALLGRVPAPLRELAENFDAANGTLVRCDRAPSVYGLVLDPTEAGWAAQAHNLDALRAALDEKTLRYLGNSYGTSDGQTYAEQFGSRLGRMYLDGVADHTQPDPAASLTDHARTKEQQLRTFGDWCAATPACALHGQDVTAVWDQVGAPRAGMLIGLAPPRWRDLAAGLAAARTGDFSRLPAELPPEPFGSVQPALLCHDFMPAAPSHREFLAIEAQLRKVAPRVGRLAGRMQLGRCVGVEGGPAYPPASPKARNLPPILIGIGELDNNTPNLGAERVAAQLPGARVVHHGDGHAAHLLGNHCLAGHVRAHFVAGTLPPAGTECAAELMPR
ncbi:alpha/beta hydrolase [Amycolatopsis sp. NPDC051758]|uniref:alpha/beta hydrolase n=1 Tax=Amycolatopsis sp. NPDC051758 TaxID=3363935 RepID=UPI00379409E2